MVGVSGSGKSILGRDLAARLAVPYAELDAIYHQPDWTPLPADQFRHRVAAIAAWDGWVIDGNYSAVQPVIWAHADTVIWLDPPRRTRLIWRRSAASPGARSRGMATGSGWRNLLTWDQQESDISCAWHHYPIYRQRYTAAARDPPTATSRSQIATRADMRRLLESIR